MTRLTTTVTAIAIVGGFGWLCYFLLEQSTSLTEAQQFEWNRMILIFNSVQSMAAAALGAILGTTVQQARVATAEARSQSAVEAAKAASSEADKAEAIRVLVNRLHPPGGAPPDNPSLAAIQALLAK